MILGLLIAAMILFIVDGVLSKSMQSAGLACAAAAFVLSHGGI